MPMIKKWPIEKVILAGFALALLLLVFIAFLVYSSMEAYGEAVAAVKHSYQVLEKLESLRATLNVSEVGTRGYILTSDRQYLQPFQEGVPLAQQNLRDLRRLSKEDSYHQQQLDLLEPLVLQKLAYLQNTINVYNKEGLIAALRVIERDNNNLRTTAQINRILMDQMLAHEYRVLLERNRKLEDRTNRTISAISAALIFMVLLLCWVYYLIKRDVTGRRKAEIKLKQLNQELEQRFSGTFEQAGVGIAHISSEGRWLRVNQKFCDILQYPTKNELLAFRFRDLSYPPDFERNIEIAKKILDHQQPEATLEHRFVCKDGRLRWTNLTLSLSQDTTLEGEVYFIVIAVDIQERKEAEEALKLSEERYRLVELATHDTIYDWDLRANTLYWNHNLETMFLYRAEDIYPDLHQLQWWVDHIHPADREKVSASLQQCVAGAGHFWTEEYRFRRGDGSYATVMDRGYITREEDGKALRMIGSMMDITERKQVELELARAKTLSDDTNRQKTEFLSIVTHELKTPLNAIIGYSEMLQSGNGSNLSEKQQKYLENIRVSGQQLLNLINDILDISRIEAGDITLQLEAVNLFTLIDELIVYTSDMAAKHGIVVRSEISPELPPFYTDLTALRQILVNLITNGIKFNHEGGSVLLRVFREAPSDSLVFTVHNTGSGIPLEKMDQLFKPFGQLDTSYRRKAEGTGLGLVLTKLLVEALGGSISIESTVDVGTTVTVKLPAHPGPLLSPNSP
jgi:PAS domain S-box-containing protein